ncbi:FtsX-like permease family protein [Fulvivirga sp. M361]|uniref:ABC transporter permease n=1 Tax=Fulvivirga sp. M361 TaxID=2594266 RepID=UPI00117BA394|nr:ABC transporter permease [Fulvivirga sp. M361]TRX52634.1 FtsX-like permease family protein [Fulvivirga sp. M361]
MLTNYFKTALRSILKTRIFSLINISGLAIGTAAFLLITLYVQFELSYDKMHRNSENIYRVQLDQYLNNELAISSAECYPGVGPALLEELPEVTSYSRLYNMGYKNNVVITYEGAPNGPIQYKHRKFLYADSSFLPLFGHSLKYGSVEKALSDPFTAVISEEYAKMYFGEENPIGKMLRLRDDDYNDELCTITGVFQKLPQNTHLKFDILFSYKTLIARGDWAPARYDASWQREDMYVYVELRPGTDADKVESKLPALVDKYSPGLADQNREDILRLQPLESIHLHSRLAEEAEPNAKADNVYILGVIAVFILIIAWINYINLSTAKAMERANEVGVRKAMGALRNQLMWQFLMESAIINLIALLLSLIIIVLVLPMFNGLSGMGLTMLDLLAPWFLLTSVSLWFMGTLLSGLYPAFILSSFKPVSVLKNKLKKSSGGAILRKSLVVFQFTASVALIAGTIIVYNQLNFMMNKSIGMDIDRVLVVERPGVVSRDRDVIQSNIDVFRNSTLENPEIKALATSLTIPGKKREYKMGVKKYGDSDENEIVVRINSMDYDFVDVFDMEVLAGRTFSKDYPNDPDTAMVITASVAHLLGYENLEDAVGQTLYSNQFQWSGIIIGVVNDYHQEALQKALDPVLFYCTPYNGEFYSMKISGAHTDDVIKHVNESWNKAFPGNPFEYFFLDDYFNQQYMSEKKFGGLFTTFAVIAVFVGCLGLLGLSSFTARQKTKEIGVRKVLGSSVAAIVYLLSLDFVKLILLSTAIAVPITYYLMDQWLDTFAYQTTMPIMAYILAGSAVLFVAFVTVSFQTVKAARANPVDSLRYE